MVFMNLESAVIIGCIPLKCQRSAMNFKFCVCICGFFFLKQGCYVVLAVLELTM